MVMASWLVVVRTPLNEAAWLVIKDVGDAGET